MNPELREIAIRAAKARLFFIDYIRLVHAWEPPAHQMEWIAALQALADGKLGTNKLLILAPPASGKTDTVLEFVAWYLGRLAAQETSATMGYVCHSEGMAWERSDEVKRIIEGNEMYRLIFPEVAPDFKAKWAQGKWFIKRAQSLKDPTFTACGIDSKVYGQRFNSLIIVDDPLDPSDVGATQKQHVWHAWKAKFENRGALGVTPIVGICTRYAEDDWPGRIMDAEPDWHVLHTKALRDDDSTYWEPEIRKGINLGVSTDALIKLRDQEPDIFQTVMQALPPSAGGGQFQTVQTGPRPSLADVERVYQFWDTALTARETSTFNAMVEVWQLQNTRLFINKVINKKAWPDEMHRLISDAYWEANERFPDKVSAFIENKAGAQETKLAVWKEYGVPLTQLDIPNKDLVARSSHSTRFFESGVIYLPDKWEPWIDPYLKQVKAFPNDRYTDMVSATILMTERLFPLHFGRPTFPFLVQGYKEAVA